MRAVQFGGPETVSTAANISEKHEPKGIAFLVYFSNMLKEIGIGTRSCRRRSAQLMPLDPDVR